MERGGDWDRPCKVCGDTPANGAEFATNQRVNGRIYRHPYCNRCRADKYRKRRYKLTDKEYQLLLTATNCPICNKAFDHGAGRGLAPVIDHCHMTENVRAVICQTCNKGLGMFYDRPDLLRNAAQYVEYHDSLGMSPLDSSENDLDG